MKFTMFINGKSRDLKTNRVSIAHSIFVAYQRTDCMNPLDGHIFRDGIRVARFSISGVFRSNYSKTLSCEVLSTEANMLMVHELNTNPVLQGGMVLDLYTDQELINAFSEAPNPLALALRLEEHLLTRGLNNFLEARLQFAAYEEMSNLLDDPDIRIDFIHTWPILESWPEKVEDVSKDQMAVALKNLDDCKEDWAERLEERYGMTV